MKRHIAWSLAFLLVSMSVLPTAYAEETSEESAAVAEVSTEAAPTPAETPAVTTPAPAEAQGGNAAKPAEEMKADTSIATEAVQVKLSNDYSDLKVLPQELKDKFDFFIREGVMKAESDTVFGLNAMITREEYVKTARVIFSLPTDEALTKPAYTTAFESLGLTNDEGGVIDWDDMVKRQELAKYLVYGLGKEKDARSVTPITDTGVNNEDRVDLTSSKFVTYALQLKIMQNQDDDRFHGSDRNVTRKMLVESAYETMKLFKEMNDSSKVSIVEAKPVGAKKVSVVFNKMFDPLKMKKAVITVKKGGTAVTGTSEWAVDNKSVTITLDQKLQKANYSVELSGLDDSMVDKKVVEFTAEDEQFKSLEWANLSDQLPRSKVLIDFKQLNQYGEQTDLVSARFDISAGSSYNLQRIGGKQSFRIDLSNEKRDSRVNITIYDRDHNLSLNKTFQIGDRGIVSKIDLGNVTYKDNKPFLQPGNIAYLSFTAYDQYGYRMDDPEALKEGMIPMFVGERIFENPRDITFFDYDSDKYPELEFEATTDLDRDTSSTLKLVALGSGNEVSQDFTVFTPKVPASAEIKEETATIAEGDLNKTITLVVRDAEGYEFSDDEKVELAKEGKIKIRSSSQFELGSSIAGEEGPIELSGGNKGNINIKEVKGTGDGFIEAVLDNVSKTAKTNFNLKQKRVPALLEKSGFDPAFKYTVIQGTSVTPKFIIKDQYDEEYKGIKNDEYQVEYTLQHLDGDAGAFAAAFSGNTKLTLTDQNPTLRVPIYDNSDKGIQLTADKTKLGSYKVIARLIKAEKDPNEANPTKWPIITATNSLTAVAQSYTWEDLDEDLTYYLDTDKNLFAVGKYLVDQGLSPNSNNKDKEDRLADATDAKEIFANRDPLTKGLGIKANNKDGVEVSFPSTPTITAIQIADPKIMAANKLVKPTKIAGLNPGNTVALITFNTPKEQKVLKENFSVFTSDLKYGGQIKVQKNTQLSVAASDINGKYVWDNKLLQKIDVFDSDQVDFFNSGNANGTNNEGLTPFLGAFGVRIILSDVTYKPGTKEEDKDTFYMTDDYKLVFIPKSGSTIFSKVNLQSFKITVTAPGNKSIPTIITLK